MTILQQSQERKVIGEGSFTIVLESDQPDIVDIYTTDSFKYESISLANRSIHFPKRTYIKTFKFQRWTFYHLRQKRLTPVHQWNEVMDEIAFLYRVHPTFEDITQSNLPESMKMALLFMFDFTQDDPKYYVDVRLPNFMKDGDTLILNDIFSSSYASCISDFSEFLKYMETK